MSQSAYAKVSGNFWQAPQPQARSVSGQQPATTGWTAPTIIYEKMRQINASAAALNNDINVNVTRQAFKNAWIAWFTNWSAFFQKYQSMFQQLAALTFTDPLFQQVLSYEAQLGSWYDNYGRETVTGLPGAAKLPPASGLPPQPNVPIPPSKELPAPPPPGDGLSIPWWGWALGAVVVAGAGYATYLYVQKARAVKRIIEERVAPAALNAYGGPMGGHLSAAYAQMRDPATGNPVMVVASPPIPVPFARYPDGSPPPAPSPVGYHGI